MKLNQEQRKYYKSEAKYNLSEAKYLLKMAQKAMKINDIPDVLVCLGNAFDYINEASLCYKQYETGEE